jgi:hypothetical protein
MTFLIASRTPEEHLLHISQIFQVLHDRFDHQPSKWMFNVSSLKFLGHMVDEAGITSLPKQVAAVQDYPPTNDINQLQHFLGLIFLLLTAFSSFSQTRCFSGLLPLMPLSLPPRLPWLL